MGQKSGICRFCLSREGRVNVFEHYVKVEKVYLIQLVKPVLGVNIVKNDGITDQICKTCLVNFYRTIFFRRKCRSSETTLFKELGKKSRFSIEGIGVRNQTNDNLMENEYRFPIQRVEINQENKETEEESSLRESPLGMDSSNFPDDRKFDVDMRTSNCQPHHNHVNHTNLIRQPRQLLKMSNERNSYEMVDCPHDIQTEYEVNRTLQRNVSPLNFHSLETVNSSSLHIDASTASRNFPHYGSCNADVKGNSSGVLMSKQPCLSKRDEDLWTMHHNLLQGRQGHLQNCYGKVEGSFCSYDPKLCHVQKMENRSQNYSVNEIDLVRSNSNDLEENIPLLIPASNLNENGRNAEPILSNTNYQKAGGVSNSYNSEFYTFLRENISEEDYFDEMVREGQLCSMGDIINEPNLEEMINLEENFNQVHQNQEEVKNAIYKNVNKKSNFLLNDKSPLKQDKRTIQNGSEIALEEGCLRQVNIPEDAVWQDSSRSSHPNYCHSETVSYYHQNINHPHVKSGCELLSDHLANDFPLTGQEHTVNSQSLFETDRDDGYLCHINGNMTRFATTEENPVLGREGVHLSINTESNGEVQLEEGFPMEEDGVAEADVINDLQMEVTASGNKFQSLSGRNEILPKNGTKSVHCSENIADSHKFDKGRKILSQEMKYPNWKLVTMQSSTLPHKSRMQKYEETTENKTPVLDSSNTFKNVAHVVDRSSNKTLKCNTCLKSFLSSEVLLQHVMRHIKDETGSKPEDINIPKREFCTSKKNLMHEEEIEILWDSAAISENSNADKCAYVHVKAEMEKNISYGDAEVACRQESTRNSKLSSDTTLKVLDDDFSVVYCNTLKKGNESCVTPLNFTTGKGPTKNISAFHAITQVLDFVNATHTETYAKNTCDTFERVLHNSTINRENNPADEREVDKPDNEIINFSLENEKICKERDSLLRLAENSAYCSKKLIPSNEVIESNLEVNTDRHATALNDMIEYETQGSAIIQSKKNRYSFGGGSLKQSHIAAANELSTSQAHDMANLHKDDIVKEVTCGVCEQKSSTSEDLVSEKIYNCITVEGNVPCRDLEKSLEENGGENSDLSLLMDICDVSSTNETDAKSNKCTNLCATLEATPETSFKNGVHGVEIVSNVINSLNSDGSKMVSVDHKSCIKSGNLDGGTLDGRNKKLSEVKSKVESPLCVSSKNVKSSNPVNDKESRDSIFETNVSEQCFYDKNNEKRVTKIDEIVDSKDRKRRKITPRFDDVTQPENLSFPCSVCWETFTSDSSLLKHGLKHHRDKTDCQIVGKKKMRLSKTKKNLGNSKKTKTNKSETNLLLPEVEQTSFPCSRCPETFACNSSLLKHGVEHHRRKSDEQSVKSKKDSDSSIKSYIEYLRKKEQIIKEKETNKNSSILKKEKNSKRKSLKKCQHPSKNNSTNSSNSKHCSKPVIVTHLPNEATLPKNDTIPSIGSTGKSKDLTLTSSNELQRLVQGHEKTHTTVSSDILTESEHASLINTTEEKHVTNEISVQDKTICKSSEKTFSGQKKHLTNNSKLPRISGVNEESSPSHYTELDSSDSLLNKLSVLMSVETYGSLEMFRSGLMDENKINECCKKIQNILAVNGCEKNSESSTFRCPMCLEIFSTWCLITTHIVTKHQESSNDWPLSLLFLHDVFKKINKFPAFDSNVDYQQPSESHESYSCDMCENSYPTNIALLKHKIWAHNTSTEVGM